MVPAAARCFPQTADDQEVCADCAENTSIFEEQLYLWLDLTQFLRADLCANEVSLDRKDSVNSKAVWRVR
jgi:hypothetical protein